eukprot:6196142-Pleurochrysis_carterae.AAC.3
MKADNRLDQGRVAVRELQVYYQVLDMRCRPYLELFACCAGLRSRRGPLDSRLASHFVQPIRLDGKRIHERKRSYRYYVGMQTSDEGLFAFGANFVSLSGEACWTLLRLASNLLKAADRVQEGISVL